jgi:hypothetical protein
MKQCEACIDPEAEFFNIFAAGLTRNSAKIRPAEHFTAAAAAYKKNPGLNPG